MSSNDRKPGRKLFDTGRGTQTHNVHASIRPPEEMKTGVKKNGERIKS